MVNGRVAERLKAPVLKTGERTRSVGSNPTPPATHSTCGLDKRAYAALDQRPLSGSAD